MDNDVSEEMQKSAFFRGFEYILNAPASKTTYNFIQSKKKILSPIQLGYLLGYAIFSRFDKIIDALLDVPQIELNLPETSASYPSTNVQHPLISAVKMELADLVKLLLERGAKPNTIEQMSNLSALHYAAIKHNAEIAEMILNATDADVNIRGVSDDTPLIIATRENAPVVAYVLLEYGADVNMASADNSTALMYAVENDMDDIVKEIMKSYTQFKLYNDSGQTPLHLAISTGMVHIVEILINNGYPVNTPNSEGIHPIIVCGYNFDTRIFELLLANGADIYQTTYDGDTVLHCVVANNDAYTLSDFFSVLPQFPSKKALHAYVNIQNNQSITALYYAVIHGFVDLIVVLLQYGANPIINIDGTTPFIASIKSNEAGIFKLFLNAVLKPAYIKQMLNEITVDGLLPISYAILNYRNLMGTPVLASINQAQLANCETIIELCVKYGSNLKTVQDTGMTVEDYIKYHKMQALMRYVNETPTPDEPGSLKRLRPVKRAELLARRTQQPLVEKSPQTTKKGAYDPILMEKHSLETWLNAHADNIILILNDKQWCMKRSYFMPDVISPYQILQDCVKGKGGEYNTLGETYMHLDSVGIPDSGIVPLSALAKIAEPRQLQRVYVLRISKNRISTVRQLEMELTNIRNKKLFDASVDLHTDDVFGIVDRKDIADVKDYTYKWDARVNYYLRVGKSDADFAKDPEHLKYYAEYAPTPEIAVDKIKRKIAIFDHLFTNYAVISPKPITVYRGVKNSKTDKPYEGYNAGYMSTSTSEGVALSFSSAHVTKCCIYKMTLLPGVPFISMYRHSQFPDELELFLPRGLTTVITDVTTENGITYYHCDVRLTTPDQFKLLEHKCFFYPIVTVDNPVTENKVTVPPGLTKRAHSITRSSRKMSRRTKRAHNSK